MSMHSCACLQWCNTYGMPARGEYHHRDCNRWYREIGEAVITKTELLVLGQPDADDESHNCDFMGCTTVSHVLRRYRLAYLAALQPQGEKP